ncbi:MAG: DUF4236 domain-containing protein [Oscillospiraceae bacterium]|nr:DUF4236 domain-containing protein [Oscillospiraceae bacterium]
MGFRFRKSFGKGPFRVTVSKSGIGYSAGVKGFRVTKKAGGGIRTTASIPGTGISYVKDSGSGKTRSSSAQTARQATPSCESARKEQAPGSKLAVWCAVCFILGLILIASNPLLSAVLFIVVIVLALRMNKLKKEAEDSTPKMIHAQPEGTPRRIAGVPKSMRENAAVAPQPQQPEPSTPEPMAQEPVVSESDTPRAVGKTFKVTGMQYHLDEILSLGFENSDYKMSKKEIIDCDMTDEKIWKYDFCGGDVELVPEPDNPYDPNAVKVLIDGKHVGYIKSGSCSEILSAIEDDRIQRITCKIGGGPYKMVYEDIDSDAYEVEYSKTNYFIHLTVYKDPK